MQPLRRTVAAAVSLVAVTALAACGGGGGSDSAASDPASASYDPAKTTLHSAGLDVCSEVQHKQAGGLGGSASGVSLTREFFVASDCKGQTTTPDRVVVYTFTSPSAVPAGARTIQQKSPKGETTTRGPLVIQTTGPNASANMQAITKALPPPTTSTGS